MWHTLSVLRTNQCNYIIIEYRKTCEKQPLSKRPKISFQDQLLLNAGQKYCRMLQWEHSAILLTFIKLQFVIKIFILSIFEWLFYTGLNVHFFNNIMNRSIDFLKKEAQ